MPACAGMTDQGQFLLRRSREDGKPNDEDPRHLGRLFDESSRHLVECLPPCRSREGGNLSGTSWANRRA